MLFEVRFLELGNLSLTVVSNPTAELGCLTSWSVMINTLLRPLEVASVIKGYLLFCFGPWNGTQLVDWDGLSAECQSKLFPRSWNNFKIRRFLLASHRHPELASLFAVAFVDSWCQFGYVLKISMSCTSSWPDVLLRVFIESHAVHKISVRFSQSAPTFTPTSTVWGSGLDQAGCHRRNKLIHHETSFLAKAPSSNHKWILNVWFDCALCRTFCWNSDFRRLSLWQKHQGDLLKRSNLVAVTQQ